MVRPANDEQISHDNQKARPAVSGICVPGIWGYNGSGRVEAYEESISRPHVRPMDVTGRPMRGWVIVNRDGLTDEKDLESWVGLGLAFNNTLPEKAGNRRRRR